MTTTSLQDYATNFVPSDNVPLNLGKHTVYVYPSVHGEMSLSEKSYAFMVNKSALESADIPIKARLQAFGDKMAATSLINILQAQYQSHSQQFIHRISKFKPRSYHGLNGRIIADSQMPNGDLTPTQGMTAANRRPAGICYVKIAVDITFTNLDSTDGQAYPLLRTSPYGELHSTELNWK